MNMVDRLLSRCIIEALGNPKGDPDFHHHYAAACAFVAREQLKLPVGEGTRAILAGNNLFKSDFLALVKSDVGGS